MRQTALVGKVDDAACEDLLVAGRHRFAVVDGATDKSGMTYRWRDGEVSSGRFAAEVVAEFLRTSGPGSPEDLAGECSAELRVAVEAQYPDLPAELLPAASVAALETGSDALWIVGDAQAAWSTGDGGVVVRQPVRVIGTVAAQFRSAVHAALTASGTPWDGTAPDPGRETILPLLRLQGALANTSGPYGYTVMNGTPVPKEQIVVLSVPDATTVVLASDGYPSLAPDGTLSLADAEAYLAEALTRDPHCLAELASTKGLVSGQVSFDDRAWLEIART